MASVALIDDAGDDDPGQHRALHVRSLFHRYERYRGARHHRGGQDAVPALGLHQRDEVRIGAERLGSSLDGGGLGLASDPDVRRLGFAVQPRGVGIRLGFGTDGVRFGGCLGDRDLRLDFFALGVLLQLLHLDLGQHALLD